MTIDDIDTIEPVTKDGNIPNKPGKTNWVEEAGGLPPYIKRVAEDLHSVRGMTVSRAIATAVSRIKVWAAGGGGVKPDTQAKASAALAQWEAMKVGKSVRGIDDEDFVDLLVYESEVEQGNIAKGLNYMEKPHRFTPGPAGACLFCANSQRWHTENRPKTPAEVEQEKRDAQIQNKNEDALGSALMLTGLPTEDDMLASKLSEQKRLDQAGKIAGAPVQDPNDPLAAVGPIDDPKALAALERETLKKALVQVLADRIVKHNAQQAAQAAQAAADAKAALTDAVDALSEAATAAGQPAPAAARKPQTAPKPVPQQRPVGAAGKPAGKPAGSPPKVKPAAKPNPDEPDEEEEPEEPPLVNVQYDPEKKAGGISEVERKELVDAGIAMEDGTFPIRDENDLKQALKFWGKAADPHAARDHIIARAYDLELLDLLPQNLKDYDQARAETVSKETDAEAHPSQRPGRFTPFRQTPLDGPRTRRSKLRALARHLARNGEPEPDLRKDLLPYQQLAMDGPRTKAAKKRALARHLARSHLAQTRPAYPSDDNQGIGKAAAYAVTKATEEERYTLGPMYVPNRLDAHREYATADELQKAVWGYVRAGNRDIRLQHHLDIVAGECVEVLSWPHEISTTLALPGNSFRKAAPVTFPAGTTYMGIVWEPWAWEWVKKGKIAGLSMGGFAKRVQVQFDDSVLKNLDADRDEYLAKFDPGQPRDAKGRWVDIPGSPTAAALPSTRGVVTGTHVPGEPFISTGPHRMEWVPEDSTEPKTTHRSDVSSLALAVQTLAEQTGVGIDHLLDALRSRLVTKHGTKGAPGYPLLHPNNRRGQPNTPSTSNALAAPTLDTLGTLDTATFDSITEFLDSPDLTDEEHLSHLALVDTIIAKYASANGTYSGPPNTSPNATYNLYAIPGKDNTYGEFYTLERRKQQQQIINDLLADAERRGVPHDRRGWIAGGLTGAGKTSYLTTSSGEHLGIQIADGKISNAVVINPDDIKTEMIARGMAPHVPGLDPLEASAFMHEESSHIANRLAERAQAQGFNIVYDITAQKVDSVADRLVKMRAADYSDVTYFLLNVSIEHSLKSARRRHREGLLRRRNNRSGRTLEETAAFGGRYVPEPVIKSNEIEGDYLSQMHKTFEDIRTGNATDSEGNPVGRVPRMVLVDNENFAGNVLWDSDNDPDYTSQEHKERQARIAAAKALLARKASTL